jgi:hypothetical protein
MFALRNKMAIKITIFLIAIITATSVNAEEDASIGVFFKKATQYAKERDYTAFKTLYCSNPPETLGKTEYFENKKKIFSNIKLTPKQKGFFDKVQFDFILYLCSYTTSTKEICMVQPVVKRKNRLCILNIINQQI